MALFREALHRCAQPHPGSRLKPRMPPPPGIQYRNWTFAPYFNPPDEQLESSDSQLPAALTHDTLDQEYEATLSLIRTMYSRLHPDWMSQFEWEVEHDIFAPWRGLRDCIEGIRRDLGIEAADIRGLEKWYESHPFPAGHSGIDEQDLHEGVESTGAIDSDSIHEDEDRVDENYIQPKLRRGRRHTY